MRLWNNNGEQSSISDALMLTLPGHAVISVTGAGGKTSLIVAWAGELASSGKRTVITTTAHMADPGSIANDSEDPYKGIHVIYTDHAAAETDPSVLDHIDAALDEYRQVMIVSPDSEKPAKVMSPPSWVLDHLFKTADAVLIEADGSRRMPLKWPASWEPVVPDDTDITVCVAGLSSIGRESGEVIYRGSDIPDGLRQGIVSERLIAGILSSPEGGLKGAKGLFRVFLNQADDELLRRAAQEIHDMLAARGIECAWSMMKTNI